MQVTTYKALAEGCEILVCTPGRLADFLEMRVVSMKRVKTVVIDDAGRMVDSVVFTFVLVI